MSTTQGKPIFTRLAAMGAGLLLAFVAIPAGYAGDDDDDSPDDAPTAQDAEGPEEQESSCEKEVKGCKFDEVGAAYKKMRLACNEFRKCKRGCNGEKSECKAAAAAAKRDCKKECKSLHGKAKKECKKDCREGKRAATKKCKGAKNACTAQCAKELKDGPCVEARNDFWNKLGSQIKSCGDSIFFACSNVIPPTN